MRSDTPGVVHGADADRLTRVALYAPRLVSLKEATAFLGGKHPTRFGAQPVCPGRDSVWDLVELNALLNKRLADRGILSIHAPAQGNAANDIGQDELKTLWDKLEPAGRV